MWLYCKLNHLPPINLVYSNELALIQSNLLMWSILTLKSNQNKQNNKFNKPYADKRVICLHLTFVLYQGSLLAWQELATSYRELIPSDWARYGPFFIGAFLIFFVMLHGWPHIFMHAYYSKLWKWLRNRKVQGKIFLWQWFGYFKVLSSVCYYAVPKREKLHAVLANAFAWSDHIRSELIGELVPVPGSRSFFYVRPSKKMWSTLMPTRFVSGLPSLIACYIMWYKLILRSTSITSFSTIHDKDQVALTYSMCNTCLN